MTHLVVAAGGGGDPLGAAMVTRHLGLDRDDDVLLLTYSWERLTVDPVAGPLTAADVAGLDAGPGGLPVLSSGSRPRPPRGSTLPRLAGELPWAITLGLLDPAGGVVGLGRQLGRCAEAAGAVDVTVVDIGGDILGRGDEPELRSPLPDAMALAACHRAGLPGEVVVAGPGLDGELSEAYLLAEAGPINETLRESAVHAVDSAFGWHPSEASALLAGAARGARGRCAVRDGEPIDLTSSSAGLLRLPIAAAYRRNALAQAVVAAATLDAAEQGCWAVLGWSELADERRRAATRGPAMPTAAEADPARVTAWGRALAESGVPLTTVRAAAEAHELSPVAADGLRRRLLATAAVAGGPLLATDRL